MTSETLDSLWRYSYQDFFLTDVHQLLFAGHQRARPRLNSCCEEDDITGFLTEALKIEVRNPIYFGRYEVQEQLPVHSSTRTGKKRQKIDLVFSANDPNQIREFCCEAKRLKTSTNTISDYTGGEGMGCFVNCEYAEDQPLGAMLAYVQSSTMSYWHGELVRSLTAATDLNTQAPLSGTKIIPQLPHEWISTHKRTNKKNMDIYHIFLDCHD